MRLDPALFVGPCPALRRDALEVLAAGVAAVEPEAAVRRALASELPELSKGHGMVVLALGKAASAMARGAVGVLGARVNRGVVVTKDGHAGGAPPGFEVLESAHPVPDERSVAAGERLLEVASQARAGELVLVLVSGGASALAEAPDGCTLAELRLTTEGLLRAGAPIAELNAVRRRLSRLKAGGLARAARRAGAVVMALCLSDVPGDDPAIIGSGPAWLGADGPHHVIVASLAQALEAAEGEARRRGYEVERVPERLEGEAREAARRLVERFAGGGRRMLIAGGETVVRVRGGGRGGRNQELALAAVPLLEPRPGLVLAALGTDGTDGPTDAAGGVVDAGSAARARGEGVEVTRALEENDSYAALKAIGSLVVTGPTGTNVGDLVAIAAH